MDYESFIVREPLVEASGAIIGYALTLQKAADSPQSGDAADAPFLVSYLGQNSAGDDPSATSNYLLFLAAPVAWLSTADLSCLPTRQIVFRLGRADFAADENLAAIKSLRQRGFGISLIDAAILSEDARIPPLLSYVEMDCCAADFAAQVADCNGVKSAVTKMLARGMRSWPEVDACAELGMGAFIDRLYLTPRETSQSRGLNPAQTLILQLMQLVRENADVRQLENLLKRDPAIAYKLLRYINSVGFGLGAEIQSLRHAVTMLGYSPLYRWLSLLLATASTSGFSPALMQAAIVRGRFAELLGQGFLPKNEAENLFVAGMFSLLDRLLGVSMEEVLENIQLSDAVSEALLTRGGMYGPFLALAEAGELHNGVLADLASAMFIDAPKVNEAHLSALDWAQNLKL